MDIEKLISDDGGATKTKYLSTLHEFYICGDIESADHYIDWYDKIRHASENDVIKIYINSYGGDLFAAIQFMRVLHDTPATILISVEGACMSAATLIFLMGDQIEVSSHSAFMFHNYSGGTYGKGGEMLDQLSYERQWSEKLWLDAYAHFLSQDEIASILENKDIWMDGDEVIERLNSRQKVWDIAAAEAQAVNETKPKRRTKKK